MTWPSGVLLRVWFLTVPFLRIILIKFNYEFASNSFVLKFHTLHYKNSPAGIFGRSWSPPRRPSSSRGTCRRFLQDSPAISQLLASYKCCSQEIAVLIQHQTHLAPLSTDPNCITQAESKKCKKQFPEFSFEGKLSPIKSSPILHYWTRPVNWPPRTSVPFEQRN